MRFSSSFLLHIVGVVASSLRHRENLPRAMVTGYKQGPADAGIRGSALPLALLLLAGVAAFWGWSVQTARLPFGLSATAQMGEAGEHGESGPGDRDDDEGGQAAEGAGGFARDLARRVNVG